MFTSTPNIVLKMFTLNMDIKHIKMEKTINILNLLNVKPNTVYKIHLILPF